MFAASMADASQSSPVLRMISAPNGDAPFPAAVKPALQSTKRRPTQGGEESGDSSVPGYTKWSTEVFREA